MCGFSGVRHKYIYINTAVWQLRRDKSNGFPLHFIQTMIIKVYQSHQGLHNWYCCNYRQEAHTSNTYPHAGCEEGGIKYIQHIYLTLLVVFFCMVLGGGTVLSHSFSRHLLRYFLDVVGLAGSVRLQQTVNMLWVGQWHASLLFLFFFTAQPSCLNA